MDFPTKMRNRRMAEKLGKSEAITLHDCKRTKDGDYIVPENLWQEGTDYCNAEEESWIWSIGKHMKTGQILAAHSTKFYENPEYICLFLR